MNFLGLLNYKKTIHLNKVQKNRSVFERTERFQLTKLTI